MGKGLPSSDARAPAGSPALDFSNAPSVVRSFYGRHTLFQNSLVWLDCCFRCTIPPATRPQSCELAPCFCRIPQWQVVFERGADVWTVHHVVIHCFK